MIEQIQEKVFNSNGKEVGYFNNCREYRRIIKYPEQMFVHYDNSIAVSKEIIKQAIRNGVEDFVFLVIGFEESFIALISVSDFLKYSWDTEDLFSGKNCDPQRACPLKYWRKDYYLRRKND